MGGSADQHYNGSWIVERSVEMGQPIVNISSPSALSTSDIVLDLRVL